MARGPRKKLLDFGGNPDHITLGLWLRLGSVQAIPPNTGFISGAEWYLMTLYTFFLGLFNSNNFAGSAALAEVCALLKKKKISHRH